MARYRDWKFVAVFLATLIAADVAYAKGSSSKSPSSKSSGDVHVSAHTTKNGTYVPSHYRSAPDGVFGNNWSTKGNINPHTGKEGTKTHPPDGYGSSRKYASSNDRSGRTDADPMAMNNSTRGPTAANEPTVMDDPTADPLTNDVEKAADSSPAPQTPPKVVYKTFSWGPRMNWATDKMNADEKKEHARLSEFLKSHGVNLVFWDKYSLDKLYVMERQVIAGWRVDY